MNDVLIVGALLLVLIGATTFYLYSRILFTERKMGLIESILLDIKMNMEMVDERRVVEAPQPTAAVSAAAPVEEADEAAFYRDVIETTAETVVTEVASSTPLDEEVVSSAPMPTGPDYDSMSRDELATLAEKRGLRVTKRTTRQAIINILREADKNTSGLPESGGHGDSSVPGASLDEPAGGAPLGSGEAEEVNLDD